MEYSHSLLYKVGMGSRVSRNGEPIGLRVLENSETHILFQVPGKREPTYYSGFLEMWTHLVPGYREPDNPHIIPDSRESETEWCHISRRSGMLEMEAETREMHFYQEMVHLLFPSVTLYECLSPSPLEKRPDFLSLTKANFDLAIILFEKFAGFLRFLKPSTPSPIYRLVVLGLILEKLYCYLQYH